LPLWPARLAWAADATVASPDGLRLRADPSPRGAVVDVLPAGAPVSVTGPAVGDWVPVQTGSGSGWVASAYLAMADATSQAPPPTATPTPAPRPAALTVGGTAETTDAVRVRGGPSTDDPVVGGLGAGAILDLLGTSADGGWWRVAGAAIGYVRGDYLRPRPEPASGRVFDVDLPLPYHRQLTPIWCDPADVEMWREYKTGEAAPSSQAFQQSVWDWELAHNAGFTQEQWDCSPYAVASALDHWMPGTGFDHFVYDDAMAATRCVAFLTAHPGYREPSVANIWRGDHYILVRGVRATADPAKDPGARILGLWVADPNKGRPSWLGQDRFVPLDRWLGELLTPVTYLTPGSGVPGDPWQNKFVTIQRNTHAAGPSPSGRRNATPADYA
jgi:uncharacterized protein YraI